MNTQIERLRSEEAPAMLEKINELVDDVNVLAQEDKKEDYEGDTLRKNASFTQVVDKINELILYLRGEL